MMTKLLPNQWVKEKIASWSLSLASNPAATLFYLLLFFIPSQLGRHFWPSFSFINGLRVDYLSPTLYFTDLVTLMLFIEMLPFLLRKSSKVKLGAILLLLAFFSYLSLTSLSPSNSLFGVLRLGEVIFISWIVSVFFSDRQKREHARIVISLSLILSSLLAIWQFFLQHSVGGMWYWLGERSFSSLTPGIANASLAGNLTLRPYATFPHPNVLAAFCVIMVTYLFFAPRKKEKHLSYRALVIYAASMLGVITVLLTMSRTALLALGIVGAVWILRQALKSWQAMLLSGTTLIFLLAIVYRTGLYLRFTELRFSDEAVILREFLLNKAYLMFTHHSLTGVGLQNFLPTLGSMLSPLTPLLYLQPVHSIYFLILAETGLVGVSLCCLLLFYLIYKISSSPKDEQLTKVMLLLVVLLLSLTDHYFYTLNQGQLLLAFSFGILLATPGRVFTRLEAKIPRMSKQMKKRQKRLTAQPLKISRIGRASKGKKQK